jgi:beta-galactosidase/beta-glucuronidase
LTIQPLVSVPADSLPLEGDWRFAIDRDGIGQVEGWADPGFDDSGWQAVTVPHTWNTMPEHAAYEGLAWYRRSVALPEAVHEAHVQLRFDATFYLARVWWNGVFLGDHEGGYTPFEFDVSRVAVPGSSNVIAVQVDNLRATDRLPAHLYEGRSFGWRNYGGIVRPLSLQITSRAFIAGQKIVAAPHLIGPDSAGTADVTATVTIKNSSTDPLTAVLTADIFDHGTGLSALASPAATPVGLLPGQSEDIVLKATLSAPKLWHFDHPHLYRWSASLRNTNAELLHTNAVTFGVRLIELRGARLFLNGEPVRLVGLSRHADSPEHGLAETVAVMAADYDDLKQLNMVFARPVHYPQHEYILDYCDRNGILLIPEVPPGSSPAGRWMTHACASSKDSNCAR